jgi:hypothetical protein
VPLQASGSPLVSGGTSPTTMDKPKTVKVRALRAFLIAGKRVEPGKEVEVHRNLGVELVTTNKAEFVVTDVPAKAAAPKSDAQGKQP